jgi:hypothetical protein
LVDAFDVAHAQAAVDPCYSHTTVLLLVRHVIESIDGVSILVERGSAENCGPLLRSAFEGQLGVLYILRADSRRRGLAYQVAHIHRKMKMHRKWDRNDPLGKQLRDDLKEDEMTQVFDRIPGDPKDMIRKSEEALRETEYVPIEQEWQEVRRRNGKDPEWFALFGGPRDVRSLAISLGLGAAYEGLYRGWSDVIHAGSGMKNIGPSVHPGAISIRPIRHPEGIEGACAMAASFCVSTARSLVQAYAPEESEPFRQVYLQRIRSRYMQMSQGNLIHAPWR